MISQVTHFHRSWWCASDTKAHLCTGRPGLQTRRLVGGVIIHRQRRRWGTGAQARKCRPVFRTKIRLRRIERSTGHGDSMPGGVSTFRKNRKRQSADFLSEGKPVKKGLYPEVIFAILMNI